MSRTTPVWLLAISLLPTTTDSAIARRTGLTRELIRQERHKHAVTPFGRNKDGLRRCATCIQTKTVDNFRTIAVKDRTYYASICRACDAARDKPKRKLRVVTVEQVAQARAQARAARKEQEQYPEVRARVLLSDLRGSDRKRDMACTLTLDFVRIHVAAPCVYCGEDEIMRTLDRIDNTVGHTEDNVVSACTRCNRVRINMPYAAWLLVAPGMRAAREAGLFGNWIGPRMGAKVKS